MAHGAEKALPAQQARRPAAKKFPPNGPEDGLRNTTMRLTHLLCILLPLCASAQRIDTLSEARAVAVRPVRPAAVPVHVLDSSALARQSIAGLSDALRRLPGVSLRDYGGAGGLTTVSVRGMGAAHTQVLTDGLPAADARNGSLDLSRYSLNTLSALTLTASDQTSLLCPVRSLAAATLDLQTADRGRTVSLTQSAWNAWEPLLRFSFQPRRTAADSLLCRADYIGATFHGLYADNNYPFTWNGSRLRRRHSETLTFSPRFSSLTSYAGGQLHTAARYWRSARHLPGPVIYFNPEAATEQTTEQEASAQARWKGSYPRGRYFAAVRYAWQQTHYTNSSPAPVAPPQQRYSQHEGYLSAGLSFREGRLLSWAYAADFTLQSLKASPPLILNSGKAVRRFSFQHAVSARLQAGQVHLTARLIHHLMHEPQAKAATPGRLTPSLSLAWHPSRPLTLRAYYKEYFRPPTFTENYHFHFGSTDLKPELTRQGGAGLTLTARPTPQGLTARFAADAYIGFVSQRIVAIPYNLFLWRVVNADRVKTSGIDLSGLCTLPLNGLLLTATATYTLQKATATARQLPYTPYHSGSLSLAAEHRWLNAAVAWVATGARWTTLEHAPSTLLPACHTFNISLWRRLGAWSLKAEILNFTDSRHCVIARYPMPGISYRLTVGFSMYN